MYRMERLGEGVGMEVVVKMKKDSRGHPVVDVESHGDVLSVDVCTVQQHFLKESEERRRPVHIEHKARVLFLDACAVQVLFLKEIMTVYLHLAEGM